MILPPWPRSAASVRKVPGECPRRAISAWATASCGGRHDAADPLTLIVAAGARKEKLRQRESTFRRASDAPARAPSRAASLLELRAASAFSFLDGSSLPEDLVEEAASLEIPAVALVDRNGVYGAPRF